jgi:hypothetical protein
MVGESMGFSVITKSSLVLMFEGLDHVADNPLKGFMNLFARYLKFLLKVKGLAAKTRGLDLYCSVLDPRVVCNDIHRDLLKLSPRVWALRINQMNY